MLNDQSDLESLILIQIIPKECTHGQFDVNAFFTHQHLVYLVKVFSVLWMQVVYLLSPEYQPFLFHIVFELTGTPKDSMLII